MNTNHGDRGIIVIWALAGLVMFAAAMSTCGTAAQTDGSAPPMRISWTGGDLPSTSGDGQGETGVGGHGEDVIQVYPGDHGPVHIHAGMHADEIAAALPEFRHAFWEGGSPGCLFTADRMPDGRPNFSTIGGGRSVPHTPSDHRAGYFSQGYHIFALAGASCEQFGIEPCGGPFCW